MTATVVSRNLTAEAAFTAVKAAVEAGAEVGVAVNAAVTDAGGNLIAFLRADGAFLPSGKIAQDKAYTAAGFKLPSGALFDALKGEPAVLTGITTQPRVAAFPGGLPIWDGPHLVGAIGVSGASAEQDDACARAGINAIGLGPNQE
ncbi:heme-binding protein [Actibacterium sp.]|uniref:GlcG/HbpS family heme-binding protein n=1 Tax=Actibacterium sp. TaxID=1872125 RepID=UPI003568C7C9